MPRIRTRRRTLTTEAEETGNCLSVSLEGGRERERKHRLYEMLMIGVLNWLPVGRVSVQTARGVCGCALFAQFRLHACAFRNPGHELCLF